LTKISTDDTSISLELSATPEDLVLLLEQARSTAAAALSADGCHQHKRGEWRKKRDHKNQNQNPSGNS